MAPPRPLPPDLGRVGSDQLVVRNGRLGVFTPLTTARAKDPRSTENLRKIVELLRREVGALRAENEALKVKLAEASAKPRSSDDFATAVQRSLDDMQAKLAVMENPVSNFALREFRLESKVYVEVTELGTVGYRFVLPGDSVDPDALSTITIDVVPLPKPEEEDPVAGERPPVSERSLQSLAGMDDDRRRALAERHVRTVGDFVAVATRARGMAALEALLEVDREQLGRWMSQAQLLTIEGLDEKSALVLTTAGIAELAGLAPSSAHGGR